MRAGKLVITIVIPEAKIDTTGTKIKDALAKMRDADEITSASGEMTYEEIPERWVV